MTAAQNKKKEAAYQQPIRFWRWSLLILLLWGATFLRLHALDHLPPGLYYDEAFDGLDAQHILNDGRLALFFTGNFGREPLHMYLVAGAMALLGESTWTLRLVTATSGLLAVPLTYCLTRALLRGLGRRAELGALLATALLAVSYWEVDFSRVAFRAIDLVPLSLLAVWLLWRGAQKRSARLYVLSGVALGLSQYTYLAARLLPLVFVGLAALRAADAVLIKRVRWRDVLRQQLVSGTFVALVTAALVFAPLGAYFALHPQQLSMRSGGLSIFNPHPAMPDATAAPPTLASSVVAVTRMFIDRGDMQPRHNLPGRPAADPLGLVGFWVGLTAALVGLRRPHSQLLLLWLGVMLLPTLLSIEAPHFLRAIGAIAPMCVLAGDGLLWLVHWLARPWPRAWPALVVGVTVISGGITYRDYFQRLPLQPRLADEFDVGRYTLAQQALALSQTVDVALPFELYTHPTALFVLEPVFPHLTPIDTAAAGQRPVVLLAAPGAELRSLVVLRREPGQPPLALLTRTLDPATVAKLSQWPVANRVDDSFGHAVGLVKAGVERLIPTSARPAQALDVTFAGSLHLNGYDFRSDRQGPHDVLELNLYWTSLRWMPEDYVGFFQLHSANGGNVAQQDRDMQLGGGSYLTTLWRPGNSVADTYTLTVPSGLQPGKYQLVFGVYQPVTIDRLPARGPSGPIDSVLPLKTLNIPDPALDTAAIPNNQDITVGQPPLFKLIGYERGPAVAGKDMAVTLYWKTLAPIAQDYTVFVHALSAQGELRAQQDGQPLDGRAPTSWWLPGEVFRDVHRVSLPADLPPDRYVLSVGVYFSATSERLPLFDGSGRRLPDDSWQLPEPLSLSGATS